MTQRTYEDALLIKIAQLLLENEELKVAMAQMRDELKKRDLKIKDLMEPSKDTPEGEKT